jgi:hypothetical protein
MRPFVQPFGVQGKIIVPLNDPRGDIGRLGFVPEEDPDHSVQMAIRTSHHRKAPEVITTQPEASALTLGEIGRSSPGPPMRIPNTATPQPESPSRRLMLADLA